MKSEFETILEFDDWYDSFSVDPKGMLVPNSTSKCANRKMRMFRNYRSEMDSRLSQYYKYEKQAAAEVVSEKPDLPNISSGESAGFIRRLARNVVQHTPNVYIANEYDDDSVPGVIARHILKTKIIGDDEYSNNMQQNLVTTARRGFTIGFDCVVPVLLQDAKGSWYMKYDAINYRDVFPEPGAKDIRQATEVYIRRYLTRGEVHQIIKDQTPGWDIRALKRLMTTNPVSRERIDHESRKHRFNPEAYEVVTWYSNSGEPFLTFEHRSGMLLRIEKNKHPLKEHPVFFYVPEKDDAQPFGKSILSLTFGRQEFQDLFMNGAMKMFYRNINPPIIGKGVTNAMPNLSPGKYTEFSNPNASLEAFTVDSQSLMMFGQISNQNQAQMIAMLGAADQQMAAQSSGGMMSQTPQGVEAQQAMVDITTNNYQKAMEQFFSRYCSYALTIYFAELKGTKSITPSADARKLLIDDGMDPAAFLHEEREVEVPVVTDGEVTGTRMQKVPKDKTGLKDGQIEIDFSKMQTMYYVQCVPGSLTELEDEKQMRILRELFVPMSQALPAIAQSGDQEALQRTSSAMQYIVEKTIELSGSAHSSEIKKILTGQTSNDVAMAKRVELLEEALGGSQSDYETDLDANVTVLEQVQQQLTALTEVVRALAQGGAQRPALGPGAGGGTPATPGPGAPQSASPGGQTDVLAPGAPAPAPAQASR